MIHRDDHNGLYVSISNDVVRDKNLSLSARGLLGFMLSFSDDWSFSFENLVEQTGATRYETRSTLAELQSAGYVKVTQTKTKQGKFSSCSYEVYEVPCVELPHTEKPHTEIPYTEIPYTEKPCAENRTLKKTNIKENQVKENQYKEKSVKEKRFVPPTVEEVKAYCETRGNSVDPEAFVAFYQSKGWKVGKNPMKDWKAAVITWEKHDKKPTKARPEKFPDENPFTALRREEGFI